MQVTHTAPLARLGRWSAGTLRYTQPDQLIVCSGSGQHGGAIAPRVCFGLTLRLYCFACRVLLVVWQTVVGAATAAPEGRLGLLHPPSIPAAPAQPTNLVRHTVQREVEGALQEHKEEQAYQGDLSE